MLPVDRVPRRHRLDVRAGPASDRDSRLERHPAGEFIQNARDRHETLDEAIMEAIMAAIVEARRTRLRPMLITALAAIFALARLAFGIGGGGSALISSSLAIPVIGGLVTSTYPSPFSWSRGLLAAQGRPQQGRPQKEEVALEQRLEKGEPAPPFSLLAA